MRTIIIYIIAALSCAPAAAAHQYVVRVDAALETLRVSARFDSPVDALRARHSSAGRESLDDVLDRLQRCCLPAAERWTGPQLLRKLDSFVAEPVFMPLYRQYADKEGFPDIGPLFRRLGIDIENGRVALRDDAELAPIRDAITRSPAGAGARAFIDRSKAQQAKRSEP